jgi:ABC-type proline/glycine betaine transport system permease subunit
MLRDTLTGLRDRSDGVLSAFLAYLLGASAAVGLELAIGVAVSLQRAGNAWVFYADTVFLVIFSLPIFVVIIVPLGLVILRESWRPTRAACLLAGLLTVGLPWAPVLIAAV